TRWRCSCPTCAASSSPKARHGCCTRSGGPATSFVPRLLDAIARASRRASASFDRLPIRVRLAAASALLTFVILCAFALTVGWITVHRGRADFNRQVTDTANALPSRLDIRVSSLSPYEGVAVEPPLSDFAPRTDHAVIKIYTLDGTAVEQTPGSAPALGTPEARAQTVNGSPVLS